MERLTRCVGFQNGKPVYATNIDMRRSGAVDKLKNALADYEDKEEQGLLFLCHVSPETHYIGLKQMKGRIYSK